MSIKILITGVNGFIGRNLKKYLSNIGYDVDGLSRQDLDLLNKDKVMSFMSERYYDLIIHTAVEGGRRTKPDSEEMFYKNILMVYNLLSNKNHFDRMITFGSGAELDRTLNINGETIFEERYPTDYYGMSKNVIAKLCLVEPQLYNFRIFNCFGYDEAEGRLIRGNIEKKLRGESMTLFSNRLMDFFYIDDLGKIVENFIVNKDFSKTIDCVYDTKYRLIDILNIINNCSHDKVGIISTGDSSINKINSKETEYIGKFTNISIEYIGLINGITNTYNIIKKELI
jgi:nucleoside-diphosphate-sugar epimerase